MKDTMKALVYEGPHDLQLKEVPAPTLLHPDDAIVRVTTSTICGTDIHIRHGGLPAVKPGTVIGHEFCGIVEDIGPEVHNFKPGDRVAVSCVTRCGYCYYCQRQQYSHCENGGSWIFGHLIDGCQAEYVRVPRADLGLYHIPRGLVDEDLIFVGDIVSTGYYGAQRANIKPADTVAVMGCGPVGMCAMASARLYGPSQIIAVDFNDHRLKIAKEQGLADVIINPRVEDPTVRIKVLTEGRGADVTIEAVGSKGTLDLALDAVRPFGTVSIIGVFSEPMEVRMNEIWIKNLYISTGLVPTNHIPEIIDLIQRGKLDMKFLITHRKPLNDILEGYEVFGEKKDNCLKWIVTPFVD
jgi:alcohol dehydrogenase